MAGRRTLIALACAVSAVLASSTPAAAAASTSAVFNALDSNHDGAIDSAEFEKLEKNDRSGALPSLLGIKEEAVKLGSSFVKACWSSLSMIIATEIGDRTFFIAAVLSMRFNRMTVFLGACGALLVMTALSTAIGVAVPAMLPRLYTHYAAAALFAYFGIKLLRDGSAMQSGGGVSEELMETEQELGIVAGGEDGAGAASLATDGADMEADVSGKSDVAKVRSRGSAQAPFSPTAFSAENLPAAAVGWLSSEWPVFSQAFTLTFLAEWGDRSQIATIAMAAAQDPWGVAIGGFVGHSLCTGLAVVGGRLLAARISEKAVALGGGTLFLLFGLHALVMGPGAMEG
jgi:putative Ca2+/H+ antiporter (TMEM165/GDT1 family)